LWQTHPFPDKAQQGGKARLFGEGLLSEALEALSPSVGGDGGELRKVAADAGLGECAERDAGEQAPLESVEVRRCACVLEVLP
jgi:hypothetical protein